MNMQDLPISTAFELGFHTGSLIDELRNSLWDEALRAPGLFLVGSPLSDLSMECKKLCRDGCLEQESSLPDACQKLSRRWDGFLLQRRRRWQSGNPPSQDDIDPAGPMVGEARQIVSEIDAARDEWADKSGHWYDLGKTVGRGKFLEDDAFGDWWQGTVSALGQVDPEGEWSEDCIKTIDSHREDEKRPGVRDLVSTLRQEILGSIEPEGPTDIDALIQSTDEKVRELQTRGQELTTLIEQLLGQPVTVAPLPRIKELWVRLDMDGRAVFVGETRVDFHSSERYYVVEELLGAGFKDVPENDLIGKEGFPPPEANIPVYITRIRGDFEQAALTELTRIVMQNDLVTELHPETKKRLKEEAARIRAVIPQGRRVRVQGRNAGEQPSYRWDPGVLRVKGI